MTILQDLIHQIDDPALRERILKETDKLIKQKKFGLVFEEHLPECTPLYDTPIRVGAIVSLKTGYVKDIYTVLKIDGEEVLCDQRETHEQKIFQLDDLVAIAQFGQPIYPTLKPIDYVKNAPDSNLWHTLIEADNYHALQLLEYLYAGKVDCIYIDPPYNTGAKDWKYNNDYVDSSDAYRHSKWLSFMEKRLKIVRKLLKPDGIIAIAIDKNEVAHLMCLLEAPGMFSEYDMTLVTVVHNPRGNITTNFAETNEYVIYITPKGIRSLSRTLYDNENPRKLRRWGHYSLRIERKSMFYPIYVKNGQVIGIGDQPEDDFHPTGRNVQCADDVVEIWPIDQDGVERRWNYSHEKIREQFDRIVVLPKEDGLDLFLASELSPPKTVWISPELDAGGIYGNSLVEKIVGEKFPYPKSLYTVVRSIEPVLRERKDALIIDFFAGSGTTLHAVNLINKSDDGHRRCIMVTNNECSEEEAKLLAAKGHKPGEPEWEERGICRSITWPRTKFSIAGQRDDGYLLDGEYLGTQFAEKTKNRVCFQIAFSTYEQFDTLSKKKQLVAMLGKDKIPQSIVKADSRFLIPDNSKYNTAVLLDVSAANEFLESLVGCDHIHYIYIITQNAMQFKSIKKNVQDRLGDYIVTEYEKWPMSLGFSANAIFFKLDFLDKDAVYLGRQFKELLPVLWLKGGAVGEYPGFIEEDMKYMMILPENKMAILLDEVYYSEFDMELEKHAEIKTVFIITDSESAYREMTRTYDDKDCYQLYRDYLDNFRINIGR